MLTSLLVFLTNLSTISFANSIVTSSLLNEDCAINEIMAPSSSLILLLYFLLCNQQFHRQ